ncbi:UNKNOWN [Stylonychia lemnae]|uniref:Uncharacterized protein n=1 Tax=Stylonychia lemnae TaxID=5949 RepID=A0A077ZYH4_STYLE|nr:UNKNOWN [Stylonychia lemnae]|eukprot:CDW73586.1 UNKNOWN [Stylonychia lemnae]
METISQMKSTQKDNAAALRYEKIKQNEEKTSNLAMEKSQISDPFFKNAKIVTCSQVLVKNGQAVAIAFKGQSHPIKDKSPARSMERSSLSQNELHAGISKKPLEPYNPNSHRNRLYQPQITMPYKNASQIVLGDRSSVDRKQFVSSSQNIMISPSTQNLTSNPGIIAERTKWLKHKQQQ